MAFFAKYLSEEVAASSNAVPLISPKMITINDFFFEVSGKHSVDRVRLLIDLYESYTKVFSIHNSRTGLKPESMDDFIFWGDVILGDFNDVDKYLVDPKQLFTNVADLKQLQDTYSYLSETQRKAIEGFLSHFSDTSGRLTVDLDTDNPKVKGRFLLIWNLLYDLYKDFNARLSDKGMAYEGMVYRTLVTSLADAAVEEVFCNSFNGTDKFVFVGLNALNECEKTVLCKLRDSGLADFCWDYTGDMIQDSQNRSSVFMSENITSFPQAAQWDVEGLPLPEINVVSVSSSVGQAKRLPDILQQVVDVNDLVNTAVVLPDEGLLTPVLNSIPEYINDINVTMGLPLSGSLLYSFMSDIAAVQLHTVCRNEKWLFYHKQVWNLFSNEIFKKSADEKTLEIIAGIKSAAKYYIPQEDLSGTPILDAIFQPVIKNQKIASRDQIFDFSEYQKRVIVSLASMISEDCSLALELEYAKEYFTRINMIQEISLEVFPLTYVRLLEQLLSSVSVPFRGEPLKGLQIMGPLETRALDFKNLIILSANEGVFPRRNVSSSFIPPELRKAFALPTYEYQDAVWAYYFYRMITRAQKVWMLSDSRTEGLKSGEESRYIKQLEYHFNLPVKRYIVKFDKLKTVSVPEITKTAEDVSKIKESVLSATSIQNYLSCPAKFYYQVIKGLSSEEEVAESLDYGMFGNVYHEVMQSLYSCEEAMREDFSFDGSLGNPARLTGQLTFITREYIEGWRKRKDDIKKKVKALIKSKLHLIDISGRNLVVTDVIVKYVLKTLKSDLELMSQENVDRFEIIGREVRVSGEYFGQKFKGFIDRLDSFHPDQVRVVDYKTGRVIDDDEIINDENAESIAEKIFNPPSKDWPKIALQFYVYDMLLQGRKEVSGRKVFNCIYSTSRLFKKMPQAYPKNEKFFNAVSARMQELIEEMYDMDVPFRRTSDQKVCEYCDFKMICGR